MAQEKSAQLIQNDSFDLEWFSQKRKTVLQHKLVSQKRKTVLQQKWDSQKRKTVMKHKFKPNTIALSKTKSVGPLEIFIFTFIVLIFLSVIAFANTKPTGPTSKKEYWIASKSLLSKQDPRSLLAYEVFSRVLSAADKKPGPIPELLILDEAGYPWARSLPDGSIILTRGAIDICLSSKRRSDAEAKLAFIIGHELSHQVNGDFWHFFFYQGARPELAKGDIAKKTLNEVLKIAKQTDNVLSKELKADQYGVIYASQAGYNVASLVERDINFFRQWAAATNPGLLQGELFNPNHPQIRQRSMTVLVTIKKVSDKIVTFEKGVVAYKKGNLSIARLYFEDFLSMYQSREAFNNLGLVYYQMAALELRKVTSNEKGFRLSLIIDPFTRAKETTIGRQALLTPFGRQRESKPRPSPMFNRYINKAVKYFIEASERDHTYAPAHNNLACAHFLRGEFASAIGQLDLSLLLEPKNPESYNNRGVAYLNHGKQLKVNLDEKALDDFKKALLYKPDYVDAIFNMAYYYKMKNNSKKKKLYTSRLKQVAPHSRLFRLLY